MLHFLIILGSALNLMGTIYYMVSMSRGGAKPNRVTWFLWALAPLIGFSAALWEGARWSAIPILSAGLGPLFIFSYSFFVKSAYWKLTQLDYVCGALSLLALIVWFFTKNGSYAIFLMIITDGLAAVPTYIKAWKHPKTESDATFYGALLGSVAALLLVEDWRFAEYGFPLYLVLMCVTYIVIFRYRSYRVRVRQLHSA